MNVRITHDAFDELRESIQELETLTAKPNYGSRQDEARNAYLLAKISMLKTGVSGDSFRRFSMERLLNEVNKHSNYPLELPIEANGTVNRDWHLRIKECRANAAGTQSITYTEPTEGGTLTPASVAARCYESMSQYDQVFDEQFSNIIDTDRGTVLPLPMFDDIETAATLVGESTDPSNGDGNDQSITSVAQIQLGSYAYRSGMVVLSLELETDSGFPWGQLLERVFAKRLARGIGKALVTGTGSSQPTGLLTATLASGSSPIIAAGSSPNDGGAETGATSVGTGDLVALYKALDPAYRPGAAWYMNDDTFVYLLGLLDKMGHPIINFVTGTPFILGKPVAICPSMPTMAASSNSVLFGNPLYFIQRRVTSGTDIRRYTQKYPLPEAGQVAYEQWLRVDSNLLVPNNSEKYPFVVLQNHS